MEHENILFCGNFAVLVMIQFNPFGKLKIWFEFASEYVFENSIWVCDLKIDNEHQFIIYGWKNWFSIEAVLNPYHMIRLYSNFTTCQSEP